MTSPNGTGSGDAPWYVPPSPAAAPAPAPAALPQSWPVPEQGTGPDPSAGQLVPVDVGPPPHAWQSGPAVGHGWGAPFPRLASPGARLGALLLDLVLVVVTLGLGWFVWSLVVWSQGTTPGKSLMRQRIVVASTGATASWGRMFLRQAVVGGAASWLLGTVSFGLWFLVDSLTVFSDRNRRLTDRIVGTLVVQD